MYSTDVLYMCTAQMYRTYVLPGGDQIVWVLSNRFLRAAFDCRGRLVAMYDRVWMRELVPASEGALGNRWGCEGGRGQGRMRAQIVACHPMLAVPHFQT